MFLKTMMTFHNLPEHDVTSAPAMHTCHNIKETANVTSFDRSVTVVENVLPSSEFENYSEFQNS